MELRERHRNILPIILLTFCVEFNFSAVDALAITTDNDLNVSGSSITGWNLFGYAETQSKNIQKFIKWREVVKRNSYQMDSDISSCVRNELACKLVEWRIYLSGIQSLSHLDKIYAINNYVNSFPYIRDEKSSEVRDSWATPLEFFSRGGDCEEFAIAKYFSLIFVGFQKESLRIVVVKDVLLNVYHAVLAVKINNRIIIMDNQIKNPTNHIVIKHYMPLYSINEDAWWHHK